MDLEEPEQLLKTLQYEVLGGKLDRNELMRRLKTLHRAISHNRLLAHEFITVILDILGKTPPLELQGLLQASLGVEGILIKDDRIVHYWKRVMDSYDEEQKALAVETLLRLARKNTLARDALKEYLVHEPTEKSVLEHRFPFLSPALIEQQTRFNTQEIQELELRLKGLREKLPEGEFFFELLDMLNKKPTEAVRNVLQAWFGAYASCDINQFIRYWIPFLYSQDEYQKMSAFSELFRFRRTPLAHDTLKEYLGHEPTDESLAEWFLDRFSERKGKQSFGE